jgi:CMP-N,N'-diacetyllegionaminic acid synthase
MTGQTIAIIPARGGSKSLPRKNLRPLLGRPLLHYAIQAGSDAKSVDRTLVTTEDAETARVARQLGAEVIDRPPELATDESPTLDAVLHAIDALEARGEPVGAIVLLQPTSPLRTAVDVDAAVALHAQGDCDSVVSVALNEHPVQWSFTIDDGLLRPLLGDSYLRMRRQDVPPTYTTVGAIFVSRPAALRAFGGFFGGKARPYVMPSERSIDIDSELDLAMVELIMSRGADSKGSQGGARP